MICHLIDPFKKNITSIEWSDENLAMILSCKVISICAKFHDGDILYSCGEDVQDGSEGFMLSGVGYIRGKALIVGTNNNGSTKDVSMDLLAALSLVSFKKDTFIQWYEDFLISEKIDLSKNIAVGDRNMSLNTILNSLSELSDTSKNEIKMMITVDRSNGVSPERLLKHFAEKIIGDKNT